MINRNEIKLYIPSEIGCLTIAVVAVSVAVVLMAFAPASVCVP